MRDCAICGERGQLKRMGIFWMVIPKRVTNCELHKNPVSRCRGSLSSMCRSGIASKDEAIRQWDAMQEAQAKEGKGE